METGIQSMAALHARIEAALNGSESQREEGAWSPVARYLDPERHRRELQMLRRHPHAVDAAARVREPGDWLASTVHGIPVLLTRSKDGALHAFINVCRHRGAALVPSGECGQGRQRFVCPYHSWTYGTDGTCIGRPHDRDFAHSPKESAGLVELPCVERFGLIWVVAIPLPDFDWEVYFGPLGREVEELGFTGDATVRNRREFTQPSNWKLVFDANLETYHFAYAHRDTIAYLFHDNVVIHDQAGDHHRVVLPKKAFKELNGPPARMEGYAQAINVIYYFFPSTILLWEGDHINGFSVSPIATDESEVNGWLTVPEQHATTRSDDYWTLNFDMFWKAIDEDFELAASMQAGIASGANEDLCFGANEFACTRFEDSVERKIGSLGTDF